MNSNKLVKQASDKSSETNLNRLLFVEQMVVWLKHKKERRKKKHT